MYINNLEIIKDNAKVLAGELLTQSKPQIQILSKTFEQNPNIWVMNVLNTYIKKTKPIRTD